MFHLHVLLVAAAVLAVVSGYFCPGCPSPTYTEYGPNIERSGFCPNNPEVGICDHNLCTRDNHCEIENQKCCPGTCGGLMCFDPLPGDRRPGQCPDFWKIPVAQYPDTPVHDCDIDTDCVIPSQKCCDTVYDSIRKCSAPKAESTKSWKTKEDKSKIRSKICSHFSTLESPENRSKDLLNLGIMTSSITKFL